MRVPSDALAASRDVATQRRRILIVDDEATVREVVGQYLELEGFQVLQAATGLEALRVAEATPPDLVIFDLTLPGIDGLEVCRRLRVASAIPILILTAPLVGRNRRALVRLEARARQIAAGEHRRRGLAEATEASGPFAQLTDVRPDRRRARTRHSETDGGGNHGPSTHRLHLAGATYAASLLTGND